MSVSFTGGPADGHELALRCAPTFLRVVVDGGAQPRLDGTLPDGAVDALDLVGDMPRAGETVHVYEISSTGLPVHWCARNTRGRRIEGITVTAGYRHRPDVDAVLLGLGDNAAWGDWAAREGLERELAQLGGRESLAGAVAAHPAAGAAGNPSDSSAPAPANTNSAGEGIASEQQPAGRSVRANCSVLLADAPSPAETVAFTSAAAGQRDGPSASARQDGPALLAGARRKDSQP